MSIIKAHPPMSKDERRVVVAASMGTVFEWYDFYLYGALAAILAKQFFSGLDEGSAFIMALLAFAAGFVVRPFGAMFFGRLGDMIGRKYTFLITVLIMGLSTFMVGILPSYAELGVAAPVILIGLRLLQGLAMGGEYGGAATYVAEFAPHGKRGAYTAWIQTTATLGLLLALLVIGVARHSLGEAAFTQWGWRIPFLMSIMLLAVSVYVRLSLSESPAFTRMRAQGGVSSGPLTESLGQWRHLKWVLLALFGLTAGQAVVWYTGHFYALFFLTEVLRVPESLSLMYLGFALVLGIPFFLLFGALSDKVGRKPIIMLGFLLATLTYEPVFEGLTKAANPALYAAQKNTIVRLNADPSTCAFQFNPTETKKFTTACDVAKQVLTDYSVTYANQHAVGGQEVTVQVGDIFIEAHNVHGLNAAEARAQVQSFKAEVAKAVAIAGYPTSADPSRIQEPMVVLLLTYLVVLVALVYAPIAAMLVEFFPTRIRYTAVSLPYHIGNGWFGGLLPATTFAIVAHTGNMYSGLQYPVWVAGATFVIGMLFIKETKDVDIYADD